MPRPLMIALTVLISLAWITNLVIGYLQPAASQPSVNAVFAIVVGALYALGRKEHTAGKPRKLPVRKRIADLIDPDDDRGDDS